MTLNIDISMSPRTVVEYLINGHIEESRLDYEDNKVDLEDTLPFDGSMLGEFAFSNIIQWCCPIQQDTLRSKPPVLMALMVWGNSKKPIFLKRNIHKSVDQCMIDEIKPLFGLQKLGTHRITLNVVPEKAREGPWIDNELKVNMTFKNKKTDYIIFRADTISRENGSLEFLLYESILEYQWIETNPGKNVGLNQYIFFEIQKIIFFRELFRIDNIEPEHILIKRPIAGINQVPVPISISEDKIINSTKDKVPLLPSELEKFFFQKINSRQEVLIVMFELTAENFQGRLSKIKSECYKIIKNFDSSRVWVVDFIFKKLYDMCDMYFLNKNGNILSDL